MYTSRLLVMVALTSLALMGAGCVSTSSKTVTTAKGSASVASTVAVTTPSVEDKARAAACGESGGTYITASQGCMCPAGYTFETKTNECLSADGTPGGSRGEAMRANLKKVMDCKESGGTYDNAKGWCHCPENSSFKDGRCIGAAGGTADQATKPASGQASPAGTTAGTAAKPEDAAKSTQEKCDAEGLVYLSAFVKAMQQPIANRYTDYVEVAHFNEKMNKCFTLITYKPKGSPPSGQLLVETSYESLGDVGESRELANCTHFINAKNGYKSSECHIGTEKYTTMVYGDFLRKRMETKQ